MSLPTEPDAPRKTALNAVHRRLGARMVDFNGWEMPVEYPPDSTRSSGGLIAEHMAVRTSVGLFDVSHMGDIRLHGPAALAAVQHMTCNDASRLAIGQAQYSALLYPSGTFVDDVIVHRLAPDDFLLVINAGTREKDYNWVRDAAQSFDCAVEDLSDLYTQIAIQGPNALRTLQKLTDADLSQVKFYCFTHGTVCGLPNTLIARTTNSPAGVSGTSCSTQALSSASCPAASEPATPSVWKARSRSTAMKSPIPSPPGRRV
jgi:aminomethyltransferase